MQYTPSRTPLALASTVANAAARHALTTVSHARQTDNGHLYVFLGGDITSEENWIDLGHYNIAPSNTAVPTITGTARVNVQLTAVAGTCAGYPAPSHGSWQWQISDNGTSGWADISGATSSTYTPVAADEGKYLRAKEGQSNTVGTVYAYSAATAAVTAAPVSVSEVYVRDDQEYTHGTGYTTNDVLTCTEGTPYTGEEYLAFTVTSADPETGAILTLLGNSPLYLSSSVPSSPCSAWSGGTGTGFSINITVIPQ
ncbi:MAG: hypothetical protein WC740_07040 [Verrucomicrobiia bacterium]